MIKQKPDGSMERYKAHVANGFPQRPGIDYHDTFSPVLKPLALCLLLFIDIAVPNQIHDNKVLTR